VFILTETKSSAGCLYLEDFFRSHNFFVSFPKPEGNEYGVMLVSKHCFIESGFRERITDLKCRVVSVKLSLNGLWHDIIGTYVPSRDAGAQKIKRKKDFLENLSQALCFGNNEKRFFCGDLNIVEPGHVPKYGFFKKWEYQFYSELIKFGFTDSFRLINHSQLDYSWFGRTGLGYRYDHSFVSHDLDRLIENCCYVHEPREIKLSDHSAILTMIKV
jgi:exodeoxyribonuclease-3